MTDPKTRQAALNASSRGQWEGFAGHRGKVSALLKAVSHSGTTRLCVLGVGNGNDLELPALLRAHREVHLVDLDSESLRRAAARQGVADHPGLRLFGALDLTGMLDAVAAWSPTAPIPSADLEALAAWPAGRVGLALPGPYDLVASTCLLRPLVGNAFHAVGEAHPQFAAAVRAIRAGHLRLLTRLTMPGGTAVLITDVASTDTVPDLASVSEPALSGLFPRLAREGRFFHGVDPSAVLTVLRQDPSRLALEPIPPWRWNLHGRVYLVWAVLYRTGHPERASRKGTFLF